MLVAFEPSDCTAAILLCRMFMLVADLSSLDVMRCLTVPPLIPWQSYGCALVGLVGALASAFVMSESFPYSCLRSPCLVLDYYILVGFRGAAMIRMSS